MKKSAFPIYVSGGPESGYHPGMTLREYYAGQAMVGLLVDKPQNLRTESFREIQRIIAHVAVAYADALIAELEK